MLVTYKGKKEEVILFWVNLLVRHVMSEDTYVTSQSYASEIEETQVRPKENLAIHM